MALKSIRVSVTIPGEFRKLLDERKKEEHIASDSKYFLSLLLFDLMSRCPHKVTADIVSDPEAVFYRVVDAIVKDFPNLEGARGRKLGKWLENRVKDLRDDAIAEEAESERKAQAEDAE